VIAGLSLLTAVGCVLVIALGAAVQGTLGIGMGMVASPLLVLADRDFVPGAIIIAVIPLGVTVAARDRHAVDLRGAGLALLGRLPGVIVGSLTVAYMGPKVLAALVGGSVLTAVAASAVSSRLARSIPMTPTSLVVAGAASGFTGTTTGVGGPPMALTYQHADPVTMRSTLSVFFTVGSVMSLVALTLSGQLGARQWQLAALLLPGVAVGLVVARELSVWLDRRRVRPFVLALCATSAIVLLIEEFV
jgi:uncharacterized protein